MKTVFISLLALTAMSGAALADRSNDLRDSDTYFGKYSTKHTSQSSVIDSNPFAVADEAWPLTAYERAMKNAEDNEHGGR